VSVIVPELVFPLEVFPLEVFPLEVFPLESFDVLPSCRTLRRLPFPLPLEPDLYLPDEPVEPDLYLLLDDPVLDEVGLLGSGVTS